MSRLLLSSVLVALVFGLTLLACIPDPVEEEWLGKVGDEFRITDDAVEEHDPVFYNTENYDSIEEAQIAYHDGSTIYLYDIATKNTETLYQAPAGFTITTMCALNYRLNYLYDLVFALEGNGECIVMRETNGVFTEIYRDNEAAVENISADDVVDGAFYLYLERGGEIFVYEDSILVDSFEGIEPSYISKLEIFYIIGHEEGTRIYSYVYLPDYGGFSDPGFYDGSNLHYPIRVENEYCHIHTFFASDQDGDVDIWRENGSITQICNVEGSEQELCGWFDYLLFTRVVNSQIDVYLTRGMSF